MENEVCRESPHPTPGTRNEYSVVLGSNGGTRREGWEETTQKEKDLLEQMRHAPHIVNPVDIETTHLERVLLVMEYLENGTLHQLVQRVKSRECRIPNLVLWRIFLCCK